MVSLVLSLLLLKQLLEPAVPIYFLRYFCISLLLSCGESLKETKLEHCYFLAVCGGEVLREAVVLLTALLHGCASVELFCGNQTLRKASYLFCRQSFLPRIPEVIPLLLATSP